MRPTARVGLLVVIASMTACGGAKQPSALPDPTSGSEPPASTNQASEDSDPSATTQVAEQADLGWIFEAPFVPTDVDVVLDTSSHAEALISVEGGTVSATGADGTLYSLEIPPDALASETTIGMTPVSDITGMSFGGEQTYSVQFSPEGLFFYKVAILTITPAEPIAIDEQIVFGYQADGKDVILAAPVVDSSEIKIQVQHFSGNGVTKGLLAELDDAQKRRGADAERRLSDALSAELIRIRAAGGDGSEVSVAYEAALAEFEEQLVKPLVAAAGESCAEGEAAIQAVYRLGHMRQVLGAGGGGDALDKYPGLLEKATQVCVVEEFELCVEEHVIHRMLGVWQLFERQFILLGKGGTAENAVLQEARDLTVACLTFRLEFESTGSEHTPEGGGYESTMTSEITLRFDPDERIIKGEAPLVNEAFEYFLPVCTATGVPGGDTFRAFNLEILSVPDDSYGHVSALNLIYHPGNTTESATITCPDGPPVNIPASPFWTGAFLGAHADELFDEGFLGADWEIVPGDEHVATKEWDVQIEDFSEAGTMDLYHTPGE
jgi:predicted small lipoprotein YifL